MEDPQIYEHRREDTVGATDHELAVIWDVSASEGQHAATGNLQIALRMLSSPIIVNSWGGVVHVLVQPMVIAMFATNNDAA